MNLGVYLVQFKIIQCSSLMMMMSPGCEHQMLCPSALPQVAHQADGDLSGQGPELVTVLRLQAVLPRQQQDPVFPPLITPLFSL